ncbi:MAG: hypothetical protein GTO05_12005 [Gemmatimonadales bacterium]|nr:hypothetical protein [Gemmatimonadales bacterium]
MHRRKVGVRVLWPELRAILQPGLQRAAGRSRASKRVKPADVSAKRSVLSVLAVWVLSQCAAAGPPGVAEAAAQVTAPGARMRSWQEHVRLESESPYKDLQWRAVGPKQAGARIEAIAVPPGNHGTIYVGVGSGNLWKTENNGLTWRPIFEKESTFTIGDVAVSSADPNIVWVGTGETQPRHSGYSYAGTGVFKSTDAGTTWRNMGLGDTHHIGKVLIHPRDPEVVYVAALGHFWSRNEERGVFRTTDGGKSWQKVLYVSDQTGAVDLVMDPSNPRILYAAAWQAVSGEPVVSGEESGIYRSTDAGDTWTELTVGLPPGPLGRIGLDVAPSNPNVVYAFVDNWSEFTGKQQPEGRRREIVGGEVYRSSDKGETWRKANDDDLYRVFGVFGWKFTDVRVSPDDEDEIFILGNRGFHSTDGGRTYERIGEKIIRMHDTRGLIMHLDQHEIWIDPLNPDRVLLGNDGGLFQSYDRGESWLHINNIPAAEFYSISTDMAVPYRIYGGTQDNAALYGPSDVAIQDAADDPWENVYLDQWTGGDSFDTYLDPTDSTIVYYEHQHGDMRRMDITGDSVLTSAAEGIRPRAPEGEEPWRFGWYTPFVMSHHDPRTLYVGGNRLFKSRNRGDDWHPISPDLSDPVGGQRAVVPFGTITVISESRFQPGLIYLGTEGGGVWLTRDDGITWTDVREGLPKKWVSRVVASRHEIGTVYASQTGFREDDFGTYLYVSRDFGETWTSIAGNLPTESVNVIREDPHHADVLYVGTDLGVYVSLDRGGTWHSICANLPTTPVHDLVVHPRDHEIVIGTHGRSIFVADLAPVRDRAGR